ncbi:MAG: mechanosensitive ion channel family protein [Halobacteriales archaeon]
MPVTVTRTATDGIAGIDPTVLALSGVVLLVGLVVGYTVRRVLVRVGRSTGVDDFVEGTTFERVADSFGTSTVGIVATTAEWFVYASAVFVSADLLRLDPFDQIIVVRVMNYVPNVIAAFFIVVFGAILGDKTAVLVSERLEGVNVSEIGALPSVVRYSVVFLAVLMALSQLGVSTFGLYILLGAYLFGAVAVALVALRLVLPSAVSGLYVISTHQYGVGDTVRVGDVEGVVQEVDLLTTRIDDGEREHVVPNSKVFENGVSKET